MVLKIEFPDDFEKKFRELAMRKYGFYKGSIKKASEEAIKKWIESEERIEIKSVKSIRGIMENVKNKISSIELQHDKLGWIK